MDVRQLSLTNLPVQLGPALLLFLQHAQLNLYSGQLVINLMDLFPMAKQGYATRNLITVLFFMYARFNSLLIGDTYKPDRLIMECFGGNIPALFFVYKEQGKLKKVLMDEAINTGLINGPMNTFEVLELTYPDFDRSQFVGHFVQNIGMCNYISLREIPGSEAFSNDPQFIETLNEEHYIMKNIRDILTDARRNAHTSLDVYDFIKLAIKYNNLRVAEFLMKHEGVNKLYASIILGNMDSIRYYLPKIDPRANNHKAYFLAVENGDDNIINLVKESIIRWNLIYDAGLRRTFNQSPEADALFNTGRDVYEYTRRF